MMTIHTQPLKEKIEQAKERLNKHVREIVQWHFDDKTGCPFWLDYAKKLDFDPKKEVSGYDDLKLLEHFKDEWLRGGPVRRWVPKGFSGQPISIFETGGSTGVPKSRVNIKDYQIDYELFSKTLSDESFPPGSDWLMLGPTGPRRLRLSIEHLAQHRGGACFFVDIDPRWVNVLIKNQKYGELELYKNHIIEQALKILKSHDNLKCLFTTPKLLESLSEKISVPKYGITGIFCGGTEMNAQFHRFAREELVPGVDFIPTYGNTLMGLAACKPFDISDNYKITYYPPHPRSVFEIVDPSDAEKTVEYGQTGRVMLTTLTKEFFMPRFLERDEGERAEPIKEYPWDGVESLRLFSQFSKSVVVGVY